MTKPARGSGSTQNGSRKLVSWKAIAEQLGCDERTAKRWEQERQMPVHRAPGGKRSNVFAFTGELDAWLQTGTERVHVSSRPLAAKPQLSDAFSVTRGKSSPPMAAAIASAPLRSRPLLQIGTAVLLGGTVVFLIVAALWLERHPHSAALSAAATYSITPSHGRSADAEQLYLLGRYEWNLRTADGLTRAIDAYTQAIGKDPSYADAYAGLAESYDLLPQFAHADLGSSLTRAIDAADKAIQLDPNLASAHRAKAFALFFWNWDIPGSEAEFRRALELDPNSAETHHWYASTLLSRLEGAECIRQIDEAQRLNSTSPAIAADAAFIHAEFGDYDAGMKALHEIAQTQPTLATPASFLRELDFARGDYPAYIEDVRHYASITRDADDAALAEAVTRGWARAGKTGLLRARARVLTAAFNRGTEPGFEVGESWLLLGNAQKALPYFKASLEKHCLLLNTMQECGWKKALASDPGYADLFASVRLRMPGWGGSPTSCPRSFPQPQ